MCLFIFYCIKFKGAKLFLFLRVNSYLDDLRSVSRLPNKVSVRYPTDSHIEIYFDNCQEIFAGVGYLTDTSSRSDKIGP